MSSSKFDSALCNPKRAPFRVLCPNCSRVSAGSAKPASADALNMITSNSRRSGANEFSWTVSR